MKPQNRLLKILNLTVLTSVVIVLVVIMLGVGFRSSSEQNYKTSGIGSPIVADPNLIGYNCSEENLFNNKGLPIAECASDYCIDTQAGIMVVEYNIPDCLPLCITQDYLNNNFGITVYSYGGYHPDPDAFGGMCIYQPKTGLGGFVGITWSEPTIVACDNPDLPCYGCDVYVYNAVFTLNDPIQIDSNHLPTVYTSGADWTTLCDGVPSGNLNKFVNLALCTGWEGCDKQDQKFQLILAQICYFWRPPTSI
jgi:hypothetical protein